MTTWSRAYKAAALFVAYTIAWDVFGILVMLTGLLIIGTLNPLAGARADTYQAVDGILVIIVGLAIGLLGNIATFFKINSEINADEMESRPAKEEEPIPAK